MERVVPWQALIGSRRRHLKANADARRFGGDELRIRSMQQWFTLSDPAMEEALHDVPLFRDFTGLNWHTRLPDEATILRFRRLLEEHKGPSLPAIPRQSLPGSPCECFERPCRLHRRR